MHKNNKRALIGLMLSITIHGYAASSSDEDKENPIYSTSHALLMWAAQHAHNGADLLLPIIKNLDPNLNLNFIADFHDDLATALICAAKNKNGTMVKLLLTEQADPNIANQLDETPLMYAAQYGDANIVQILLDAGANPNNYDTKKRTALMFAILHKNTNTIRALLTAHVHSNPATQKNTNQALAYAASYGHVTAVELLLGAHANPAIAGQYGKTALTCAAENFHSEPAQIILHAYNTSLTAQCPAIRPIQQKIPKISETFIDLLSYEIIDLIFNQLAAPDIANIRLVNSNYLLYSHNKFEKIKKERATRLKTTLINYIQSAQQKLPTWTPWAPRKRENRAKIVALLNSELEKADALDLLVTQKKIP